MTKKATKRALLSSALALVVCISMLIGTTYAWFTDSVISTNNIIKSGNLDVELYYMNDETSDWTKVDANTNIFKENTLWEPGHTEVIKLKVVNEGTLALKYNLGVNVASEIGSVNVAGEDFKLSDYIKYAVIDGAQTYTRDTAVAAAEAKNATALKTAYNSNSFLLAAAQNGQESADIFTMVVYMPTTVGNEANYAKDAAIPTIRLGINLFATQYTYESDSYDQYYDQESAVFTVEEANALMAINKNATLVNCFEPNSVLEAPANYTGTLTLANSTVKSIQGAGDLNVVILGNVVVNANTAATTFAATNVNGSAITANGKLTISGNGNLTAIAADVEAAFGIGGMNTTSVTIKDVTIDYVSGGFDREVGADEKYYKDAPEGGAAIGSGYNGAKIVLDNVTVNEAIGGSKAAGIGARYHVGVNVTINNSTIKYVEGGVSAAGIGGSRISSQRTESGTTINITSSDITAKGGAYGAGIGSGYDTHCNDDQPLCTINIVDSTINATGGRYAAGVGTGYHHAALAGEIENSTINATSGDKFYKSSYTPAMDIGFGVVDPSREGQQTSSKLICNGVEITLASAPDAVDTTSTLAEAVRVEGANVYVTKGTYTFPSNVAKNVTITCAEGVVFTGTSGLNINGSTVIGATFSNPNGQAVSGTINGTFKNCTFEGKETLRWCYTAEGTEVLFENCVIKTNFRGFHFDGMDGDVTFKNCEINGFNAFSGNGTITLDDCTLGSDASNYNGLNIYTNTVLNNCTFNFEDGKTNFIDMEGTGKTLTINNCTATFNKVEANVLGFVGGSKIDNNTVIIDGATVCNNAEQAAAQLTSGAKNISIVLAKDIDLPISTLGTMTGGSGEYKLGGEATESITIDLNGKKLNITTTYWSVLGAKNANATFTIKNGTMTSSQATGTWNSYDLDFANCNYVIENVNFEKAIAFTNANKTVNINNVTINETHDYYAMWISAEGQKVEIDGLTVISFGRGIKIDEQYVDAPAKVTLNIKNSKFTTAKKAAILVKSEAGAEIKVENFDISNVSADSVNAVWVDSDAAASANKVTVNGNAAVVEQ